MKNFKYKSGFKIGSITKCLPQFGFVSLDENVTDEVAALVISLGINDIFEPIEETLTLNPNPNHAKGKKHTTGERD